LSSLADLTVLSLGRSVKQGHRKSSFFSGRVFLKDELSVRALFLKREIVHDFCPFRNSNDKSDLLRLTLPVHTFRQQKQFPCTTPSHVFSSYHPQSQVIAALKTLGTYSFGNMT
jgi:hypothetical protein